jgi:stromal membrane-associated protein
LSLFSSAPVASNAPPQQQFGGQFGGGPSPWNQASQAVASQPQVPQSMMGNAGVGMWGASSGWAPPANVAPPAQTNVWGAPASAQNNVWGASSSQPQQLQQPNVLASGNDIWGGSANTGAAGASNDLFGSFSSAPGSATQSTTQKKDDAFGDIWGGFK